jgi:hypothetical protein
MSCWKRARLSHPQKEDPMLLLLKRVVLWFIGLEAVVLLLLAPLGIYRGLTRPGMQSSMNGPVLAVMSGMMLVGLICACAWWTNRNRMSSGKAWGIAVSVLHLLAWLLLLSRLPHAVWGRIWTTPLIGIGGLIVFLADSKSTSTAADPKVIPVAGDGTSHLLNQFAAFFGAITSVCGIWWWIYWSRIHGIHVPRGLMYYAEILGLLLLVVTTHELGHTAIGLGMEMKLRRFAVGPFQWSKREGKWEFRFEFKAIFALGGAVGVVPTTAEDRTGNQVAMIIAGPATNLLLATLALGTVFTADSTITVSFLERWRYSAR